MQQYQLWLDFYAEAAGRLKQAQQHPTKGDFFQRPVKDRLANRTYCRLKFIHAGIFGRPAGFDMHFGDAFVIAAEEGDEILCKVVFVDIGERAHDAEIQRDIAAIRRHLDVARMHVGVKEPVAKYLRVENLDPVGGKPGDVHARCA